MPREEGAEWLTLCCREVRTWACSATSGLSTSDAFEVETDSASEIRSPSSMVPQFARAGCASAVRDGKVSRIQSPVELTSCASPQSYTATSLFSTGSKLKALLRRSWQCFRVQCQPKCAPQCRYTIQTRLKLLSHAFGLRDQDGILHNRTDTPNVGHRFD